MKALYFNLLHQLLAILAKSIGYIHAPFSHKYIQFCDVQFALSILQPGDVILDRTLGELTTLIIPGQFKHAALYIGNGKIVDATHLGVTERFLADLMMDTDNVAILRVPGLTEEEKHIICDFVHSELGLPYDYEFDIDSKKAMYCSELVYFAVNYAKQQEYFDLRESLGIKTITPNDLYMARKKLDLIWEKLSK